MSTYLTQVDYGQVVRFVYTSKEGETHTRTVTVTHPQAAYFKAWDHAKEGFRTFSYEGVQGRILLLVDPMVPPQDRK